MIASRNRSRGRTVALAVISAFAVVIVGSVWAGERLRSPAQAVADAAPPVPSLVTVSAERRVIAEPVVLRGIVTAGASVKLYPSAAAVGPESVITSVHVHKGQMLREGQMIADRAGTPLIGLALPFALYRDIVGGMRGPDVMQLQLALRRLGLAVEKSGVVDTRTQRGIDRFFAQRGYTAPAGSSDAVTQLAAAREAVAQAEQEYDDALASGTGVAAAKLALQHARQHLANVELEAGPSLPRSVIVTMPRPSGRVTAVKIAIGSVLVSAENQLVELDGKKAYLAAVIARDQGGLVREGLHASVFDDGAGEEATAVVVSVGKTPVSDESSGQSGIPVRLNFTSKPMKVASSRSVRITIAVAAGSQPVLAVPITGVYSRSDATTFVTVARPDAAPIDVSVRTGQIGGGWVEVTPEPAAALAEGDPVVVGDSANTSLPGG